MVKELRVVLDEEEHKFLTEIKDQFHCRSWHSFLIIAAKILKDKEKVNDEN